jgi:exodeoxyribonuclease VII large subunit
MNSEVLTVNQLVMVINEIVGLVPENLLVEGEVQRVRVFKNFLVFFELVGESSVIGATCSLADTGGEVPKEGQKIRARGEVQLGKKTDLKFKIREFEDLNSLGNKAKELEELKLKLRLEGLFSDTSKLSLPRFPKKVAVITSPRSSAAEDFKRISAERFGAAEIEIFASTVQGNLAESEVCLAIQKVAARIDEFDVLAIVRGGGSKSDLEVFNSEKIARMVFDLSLPVVSGIGHEDDVSVLDLVADRRASTPSNAAELIFPDKIQLKREILSLSLSLSAGIKLRFDVASQNLEYVKLELNQTIQLRLETLKVKLKLATNHLNALDFEYIFARGFAFLSSGTSAVNSVSGLKAGEVLEARLQDGKLKLRIEEINK